MPDAVRNKAQLADATGWIDELPSLIAELEERWQITVGSAFADSTEAYVARATAADGTPAVLKLVLPQGNNAVDHEATALRLADGHGFARLLNADLERGALLVERLGRSLFELRLPYQQRLGILCDAARRAWRPAADAGLPTGADKARWLVPFILEKWESLDRPCSEQAVAHALTCAQRRIEDHDEARARLVHGDVHQWNTLRSGDGFSLIDPDGLLADPEYDLGVILREDPAELLDEGPWTRARWLAQRSGLDPVRIFEWGAVERVSTGLLLLAIGLEQEGNLMLRGADAAAVAT